MHGIGIIIPDSLEVLQYDNLAPLDSEYFNRTDFKILTFVSGDCYCCIKKIIEWEALFHDLKNNNNVQILFVIHLVDYIFFKNMYYSDVPLYYSLIIDSNKSFFQKNNIPSDKRYQTMLLDKKNKIILIGNPNYNEQLKELYLNTIKNI